MASSTGSKLLSPQDAEKLFKAAARVTDKLENGFLKTVGSNGRKSHGERFTTLTVAGFEDSSGELIINNVSVKEYAIEQVQTALDENENVVNLVIFMLAHLHRAGCLLNSRGSIAITGYVLVNVLSFVLLQLRKQGHKDVKSISIVVGDLVENRQDQMNGLEEDIHLDFWPIGYLKQNGEESTTNYALGELKDDKNQSENFFTGGVELVTSEFHGIQGMDSTTTTAFLTAKGTYAAKKHKIIPSLKDREPQSKILTCGHPSNRRRNGRVQMQQFSTHVIICAGGKKPPNGEFLNDWHSNDPSQWFSPMITVDVSPLHNARPFTYQIQRSKLLGSYEETGGGAEAQTRMDQRIAKAQEKREKREREAEKRRLEKERKEAERRLEKEARSLEVEATAEAKKNERQEIAEAKRIERQEIEAAKLDFRIDTANLSDKHDPAIIAELEEVSGDLDTIDQEQATLIANTEELNHNEISEKFKKLETLRWRTAERLSELFSVVVEKTRPEVTEQRKKRALKEEEERINKQNSSMFDLLSQGRRCA